MSGAMMRMIMILAVLFCSMHVAEPASAHAADSAQIFEAGQDDADKGSPEPAAKFAHTGHHHCPVAPDVWQASPDAAPALVNAPLFAAAVVALASRASPPLLDPPLA